MSCVCVFFFPYILKDNEECCFFKSVGAAQNFAQMHTHLCVLKKFCICIYIICTYIRRRRLKWEDGW